MKTLLANKLLITIIGGMVVIAVGTSVYFGTARDNDSNDEPTTTVSADDFQRTGEKSFGLAVCDEMTMNEVAKVIGKTIVKTEDYSNGGSTGCKYFVENTDFVIIDVGYGDMAVQKKGLEFLDRTIETESRIKLENMLAYSEKDLSMFI